MLNQIINMVMRRLVNQGINAAMKGGSDLVKSQMDKRKAPPAQAQKTDVDPDPDEPPRQG